MVGIAVAAGKTRSWSQGSWCLILGGLSVGLLAATHVELVDRTSMFLVVQEMLYVESCRRKQGRRRAGFGHFKGSGKQLPAPMRSH